jgi:hypothetical protein
MIRDILESLAYVAQIIAVGVLIYAARAYVLQRQQLNFDVVTNCNQRFQAILPGLFSDDGEERKQAKIRYVDLCNEELFYFSEGYVPSDVIEEWIDGMVLYLPHHVYGDWCLLPEDLINQRHRIRPESLDRYSRIWEAFGVSRCYDLDDEDNRTALVKEIYDNIEKNAKKPRFSIGRPYT